jgi:glucose-1-phosphate thymidylyltransferase
MKIKKGIILAGGTGSRLYPLTIAANKQLLPLYDKPVLYYPLTTLMLAGIQEFLIISTPHDLGAIRRLLGSGEQFGVRFTYQIQEHPKGLPDAFIVGGDFIQNDPVALILGDNFFHGHGLSQAVYRPAQNLKGAHLFTYPVQDPHRYGIISLGAQGQIKSLEEKPKKPKSNMALTGLYYFDHTVTERSKTLQPSPRGELEIVDLIRSYLNSNSSVSLTHLGRGHVWFDAGTPKSLLEASQYVDVIQSRQGTFIASPEEVAWRMGFITDSQFKENLAGMPAGKYHAYLEKLLEDRQEQEVPLLYTA